MDMAERDIDMASEFMDFEAREFISSRVDDELIARKVSLPGSKLPGPAQQSVSSPHPSTPSAPVFNPGTMIGDRIPNVTGTVTSQSTAMARTRARGAPISSAEPPSVTKGATTTTAHGQPIPPRSSGSVTTHSDPGVHITPTPKAGASIRPHGHPKTQIRTEKGKDGRVTVVKTVHATPASCVGKPKHKPWSKVIKHEGNKSAGKEGNLKPKVHIGRDDLMERNLYDYDALD